MAASVADDDATVQLVLVVGLEVVVTTFGAAARANDWKVEVLPGFLAITQLRR